ncbi:MAG: tetraacyldisaccharide 4'-kinase [Pseudomonadota bacterium]|nr:tetraacyldisaccharide 4'-kinase [Pseudomonadota bacterium]
MANLKQALPAAWQRQAPWLALLLPFSGLYALVTGWQRWCYRVGLKQAYRAPVPVMVIGNITVGGSGKTPLIIHLVQHLQQHYNLKVGVISRGYGGQGMFPKLVTDLSTPDQVGDEPVLIVQQTQVPMAVAPNRQAAIECLLRAHPIDLILSDDGLQHLALARDIEWIVLDANRGLGSGWLLPAGSLRESAQRLHTATVIEHGAASTAALNMQLQPLALQPLNPMQQYDQIAPQRGQTVHAVAGIGHPQRFFQQLRDLDFIVIEHAFADHHVYRTADVDFADGLPMLTTSKDAVKLFGLGVQGWILPVEAVLSEACYVVLEQQLQALALIG